MSYQEKRPGHDEPMAIAGGLAAFPPGRRPRVPAARGDRPAHPPRARRPARSPVDDDAAPPPAAAGGLAEAFDEVGNASRSDARPDEGSEPDADPQREAPAVDPSDRAGPQGYPAHDVVLEQLAHRFAYKTTPSEADLHDLLRLGYTPHPGAVQMHGLLAAFVARPVDDNPHRSTVVAFRGTDSVGDLIEDFNGAGIGAYRFARNDAAIGALLRRAGGRVTVTGHSLGGALAQMAAALYPELVARCVTFEGPGIPRGLLDRMRASREGPAVVSRHHVVDADVIPEAGDGHTPGDVYRHDAPDDTGPLDAHTAFPLAEEAGPDAPAGVSVGDAPDIEMGEPQRSTTGDPSRRVIELGRRVVSLGAPANQANYTRFWLQLRRLAELGTVRYRELLRRIERFVQGHLAGQFGGLNASSLPGDGAQLRANLDAMFPELRAASTFENAIRQQTIPRPEALVAAVRHAGVDIDATREHRLRTYFQHVRLHFGMPWVPDALGSASGVDAVGRSLPVEGASTGGRSSMP